MSYRNRARRNRRSLGLSFLTEGLERRTLLSANAVSIFTVNTLTTTTEVEAPAAPVAAQFLLKRDGDLSAPLAVSVSFSGTATLGVDYSTTAGPYVIPAGSNSLPIKITAIDDTQIEGSETVIGTVNVSPDYDLGTTTAQITVADNESVDADEPNDSFSTATYIGSAATSYVNVQRSLDSATDEDFLKFDTVQSGLRISTKHNATLAPIAIDVYGSDQTLLGTSAVVDSSTQVVSLPNAPAGSYFARVHAITGANTRYFLTIDSQRPFPTVGQPATLVYPTIGFDRSADILAMNFDSGGDGVAYSDTTPTNTATASIRSNYGVDIRQYAPVVAPSTRVIAITDTHPGEWVEYSIDTQTAADYLISAMVANTQVGGALHFEVDGVAVTGSLAVPNTGSFETPQAVKATASLTVGKHVIRVAFDAEPAGGISGEFLKLSVAPAIPAVGFPSATFNGSEPEPTSPPANYQFPVNRVGSTDSALTVTYTVGGTATAGLDYTAPSGALVIPAGASSANIVIPVLPDYAFEPTETIVLMLQPSAGFNLTGVATQTINIADRFLTDPNESNDTLATATNVGLVAPEGVTYPGTITAGDHDFFRPLPWQDNGKFHVTLSFGSQAGDLTLIAYNTDGVEVGRSDTVGDTEILDIPTGPQAYYYFEVLGKDGATNGHYSINFQWSDSIPPTITFQPVLSTGVNGGGGSVSTVPFNTAEPTYNIDVGDLRLSRNGTPIDLTGSDVRITSSTGGYQVENLAPFTARGGRYTLAIPAAGSGIVDLYGNAMVQDASVSWINDYGISNSFATAPVADGYVQAGTSAGVNFGSATQLRVGPGSGTATSLAYFKFDLTGLDPDANEIDGYFRVYGHVVAGSPAGVPLILDVVNDSTWTETALTYNNRPALSTGNTDPSVNADFTDRWFDFPVSQYVAQKKAAGATSITFALSTPAATAGTFVLSSKEAADHQPQLTHVEQYSHVQAVFSADEVVVPEGGSATVGVRLNRDPVASTTIHINNAGYDTDLQPVSRDFTFDSTNWSTPQTLTFTAAEDTDAIQGFAGFYATINFVPGQSQMLAVREQDNDFASVTDAQNAGVDLTLSDGSSTRAITTTDTQMTVRKSATAGQSREAYFKFDLTKVAAAADIQNVKVRLWGKPSATGSVPVGLYSTNSASWSPTSLTWSTRPATGATPIATKTITGAAAWYEYDVTSYIKAQKQAGATSVGFALKATGATSITAIFNSLESTTNKPTLAVTKRAVLPPESLIVSSTGFSVKEGTSGSFTVKLAAQPAQNVTVSIAGNGDADLHGNLAQLTFTPSNWATAQTITVSAAQDADTASGSSVFTVSTVGLVSRKLTIKEIDDDGLAAPVKTLRPLSDAYVRDGTYAGQNFGTTADLIVRKYSTAGNSRNGLLQFDLSSLPAVNTGKLRLFGKLSASATAVGVNVYSAATQTWTETGVTWNNQPAAGTSVLKSFTVSGTTGTWYEVDLTTFLKAEKAAGRNKVTLVLKALAQSEVNVTFASDEAGANGPILSVT